MFELLVIVFIFSLFGASLLVIINALLRVIDARTHALSWSKTLLALVVPGGIAYYIAQPKKTALKRWHRRLQWIAFMLVFIGSFYLLFLNVPGVAAAFFYGF